MILEKLSELPLGGTPELMPDGKRFVIVTSGTSDGVRETRVIFLLNFSDELNRRNRAK